MSKQIRTRVILSKYSAETLQDLNIHAKRIGAQVYIGIDDDSIPFYYIVKEPNKVLEPYTTARVYAREEVLKELINIATNTIGGQHDNNL